MSWFFWLLIGLGIFILMIIGVILVLTIILWKKEGKYLSLSDWIMFFGEEGIGLPFDELGVGELVQAGGVYEVIKEGEKAKKAAKDEEKSTKS